MSNIDKFGVPGYSLQPNYDQYQPSMRQQNSQNQPLCSNYQQERADFDAANQLAPVSCDRPGNNKVIRNNSYQHVSYQQPTLYNQNVDVQNQHQMRGFSGPQFQQQDFDQNQQQGYNGCFYNSNLVQPDHGQYNNGLLSLLMNKKV